MIANGWGELRQWAVPDCAGALAFYTQAFGARELTRECLPDGHVVATEVAVGPYLLSLTEEPGSDPDGATVWARPGLPLGCTDLERTLLRIVTAGGSVELTLADSVRQNSGIAVQDPVGRRWLLYQVEGDADVPNPRMVAADGEATVGGLP
jgi:PhnB protein